METEALFMVRPTIPFIGLFFKRLHTRFHAKWKTLCRFRCSKEGCNVHHVEHCPMPDELKKVPHGKVGEGICTSHFSKVESEWDTISPEDVAERFGQFLVDSVCTELKVHHLGFTNVEPHEIRWSVNDLGQVRIDVRSRVFYHSPSIDWVEIDDAR